jgi:hypothetical protein
VPAVSATLEQLARASARQRPGRERRPEPGQK